jgi:O-antigen ligase
MAHYNVFGIYSLLILTIYLSTVKKVNFLIFPFLFAGDFLSTSRKIYAGFLFVIGLQIFRRRWAMFVVLIPLLIIIYFMIFLPDMNILNYIEDRNESVYSSSGIPYRVYAREKALIVWRDHPIWGVGPGMFGGAIAMRINSYVYEEYNFTHILRWFKSLDQFYPQILAETGVVGFGSFFILFISLPVIFLILRRQTSSYEVKDYFTGLILFVLALFIYMFGSNLNINPVLFTFFAITGMGLGFKPST